ncbi:hypothetical protein SAY87_012131 [Trapa incisa]|uniref:Uncharacterized protein n=1 Tax=Trapa incisa TaxID=236973 RepID=A0AAN7GPV1_9MYRT|nr:hypothetical protein SAY87_012131 [Trapa incisa]
MASQVSTARNGDSHAVVDAALRGSTRACGAIISSSIHLNQWLVSLIALTFTLSNTRQIYAQLSMYTMMLIQSGSAIFFALRLVGETNELSRN